MNDYKIEIDQRDWHSIRMRLFELEQRVKRLEEQLHEQRSHLLAGTQDPVAREKL